ncbi:DUF1232 domain-containing protein [Synechococcus sp. M16CYN]|uniref:YkvA family protein n=1 Tax=Synechococcus sp. M16CYN TaxID=3103139 RepID=UPI0030DFE524
MVKAATGPTIDADVVGSEIIDEGIFRNLLRRAGRQLAIPALEAMELLLGYDTPTQVRLTMLTALSYLLLPADLVPDILPVAGFSDDLVVLTTVIGLWNHHVTPEIRSRAQRRLNQWFPLSRERS